MNKTITIFIIALMLLSTFTITMATEPTAEEIAAFKAAVALYDQSMRPEADPEGVPEGEEPPTPEELKQDAILAFQDFITTYTESEALAMAQNYIGWCYYGLGDSTNAKAEFNKVINDYPSSDLVDDAKYQIAFIDFQSADYETALAGFNVVIADYEDNTNEALTHKVPFAYFMVGECYRKMDEMDNARAKWNELIAKFPTHSQAGRAEKRLSQ
jgi:TolA-binding protein